MKHPRAANFIWKCANGRYVYWFHNHGGRFIREPQFGLNPYDDRNPVWLCGGVEADSPQGRIIRWSQPEIVLYDDDPYVRISYPDLVEEDGRYFLTETQKNVARVHEVDPGLLEGLWRQDETAAAAVRGLLLDLNLRDGAMPISVPMPRLPPFTSRDTRRADYGTLDARAGFSVEIWARFGSVDHPQVLVDNRTETGQGFCLQVAVNGTVELVLNDGRTENRWACDPGRIKPGALHHLVAVVDGGPKIITFVVDGQLCDGGEDRQFGWGRFSPHLRGANGGEALRIAPGFKGELVRIRLYDRYLRTSEAVGNYQAGV